MTTSYNIASLLEQQADARPHQRGVVFPQTRDPAGRVAWTHLTFRQLDRLSSSYARGMQALGIRRGDRVSLLVTPCLEFIPLTFAIYKLGALPVLIDPGMGRARFLACIERIAPRVLIAVPLVQGLRLLFRKAFASVEISITVGRSTGFWGGATLESFESHSGDPFETVQAARDDEAAILFTSGSTGPAKGVTYTHGIFHAQARLIAQMYSITPGEIDLACFPLFGLFSMAMGMTVVIPDMNPAKPAQADPRKLVEAITSQGCTSAFGSPAIWKGVARHCQDKKITLPSMRRLLMAGAPVPVWMHQAFAEILPGGAEIHTPYGATESLPVASISSREVLDDTRHRTEQGGGTCVGRPVPEVDLRIIRITDDPIEAWSPGLELPRGEIGEILVRGPIVTPEYKNEPHHTAAAKVREVVDGETVICHRIGDVGYLDDAGRLWFCGRKTHRVQCADGTTLFTVPCESIFNTHPAVYRTALVGVDGTPVLVVELESGVSASREKVAEELLAQGAKHTITAGIQRVLFHPAFPVDVRHNAKIHRGELAAWAARREQ